MAPELTPEFWFQKYQQTLDTVNGLRAENERLRGKSEYLLSERNRMRAKLLSIDLIVNGRFTFGQMVLRVRKILFQ